MGSVPLEGAEGAAPNVGNSIDWPEDPTLVVAGASGDLVPHGEAATGFTMYLGPFGFCGFGASVGVLCSDSTA